MNKIKIFCFGFGQVAKSFIKKIYDEKIEFDLNITSQKDTCTKSFDKFQFQSFQFNEKKFDNEIVNKLKDADYILVSIPPINGEEIILKNLKDKIKKIKTCKWITYLSATSVYGNHEGKWVNEKSETKPSSSNGKSRLKAERSWLDLAKNSNLPLQIFRLSGIYSKEFNILKRLQLGKAQIVDKQNHFFSRIHLEDIANILFKSLNKFKKNEIYNISDDRPASQQEVATYGSKLLKIKLPKAIDAKDLDNKMLKNFYKDSKKVDNKKMKEFFNYKLKYPSYIEGLNYINKHII